MKKQLWKTANLWQIVRETRRRRCDHSPMEIEKRRQFLLAFVVLLVILAWAGLIFLAITVTQTVIAILEFAVEALSVS
jgi:hypothetical protein